MNRQHQVTTLYEQGATYEAIGQKLGVSRERVRQLLNDYGIVKSLRVDRIYATSVVGRETAIQTLFYDLRSDRAVARRLGIDEKAVHQFVNREVPDAELLRRRPTRIRDDYSDATIGDCLRSAADELRGPITYTAYSKWSAGMKLSDGRPWPTAHAMMRRFGSWRAAISDAALPLDGRPEANQPYDLDDMTDAVTRAWRELGSPPTTRDYDNWRNSRVGLPSSAMSRRFAASWDDVLISAYPSIHSHPVPGFGSVTPTR